MRKLFQSLVVLAMVSAPATAADLCPNTPQVVRNYLKAHPGWKILALADLIDDDRQIWRQDHKGLCPGMAEVDLDGSGKKFVGLALIRHSKNKDLERIILVRVGAHGLEQLTIYPKITPGTVIWRIGPGITWEWDEANRKIRIPNDSLIVEKLEAAAQQFYLKGGKLHYVQTSD